jgi:hypothetical protein
MLELDIDAPNSGISIIPGEDFSSMTVRVKKDIKLADGIAYGFLEHIRVQGHTAQIEEKTGHYEVYVRLNTAKLQHA